MCGFYFIYLLVYLMANSKSILASVTFTDILVTVILDYGKIFETERKETSKPTPEH